MNIGIFMHSYLPKIGGAQVTTHCLASSLSRKGHNVTVFADNTLVRECRTRGWSFPYALKGVTSWPFRLPYWLPWLRMPATGSVMASKVLIGRLDVVQLIMTLPWLPVAKEVKMFTRVPILLRSGGDDLQVDDSLGYGVRRNQRISRLLARGFPAIDAGIAISRTVTEEYVKAGIPSDRIVEIPPGVDSAEYDRSNSEPSVVRRKWGIPTDKKVIISVGRNHSKKGFSDLLEALAILNRKNDRFAVAVVGKGSDLLTAKARELGVVNEFVPIPELDSTSQGEIGTFPSKELIELYKCSDYFVLPSHIETYANVALESMAAGTPVVVTNAPGCIDTVVDGEDGLIVSVGAPQEIADRILLLEDDALLREKIVGKGRIKAQAQDWDFISQRYLDVYKRLEHARE